MNADIIKTFIKRTIIVLLGNFIYAVSVSYFVLPNNMITGGVAGIGLVVNKLFDVNLEYAITVASYGLFIIGCIFLGKQFAIQTVLCSITYPLFITLLGKFPLLVEFSPLIDVFVGGAIAGVGLGIVIKQGATTGGTDIPPLIINKYTGISVSLLMFITDGIIAAGALIAFSIENILYGIMYIYIYSTTMNKILVGDTSAAVQCIIITTKIDDICQYIHVDLDRGSTLLKATGGYSKKDINCILTVVSRKQYDLLNKKVQEVDEKAFIIATNAKDVKGEGFSYYLPS